MPFPQGYALWTVNLGFLGNSVPLRIYGTLGDTLINGGLFTKVGWVQNTNSPFEPGDLTYHGAVRDDEGRWFFVPSGDSAEYILYDFTASVGDTVTIHPPNCGFTPMDFRIQAIEEIELLGDTRRSWTMEPLAIGTQTDIWVEGLGSLENGIFGHYVDCIQGAGSLLICFEEDGLLIHLDPNADSCYYTSSVGMEELHSRSVALRIHPNPAWDRLVVEITECIGSDALRVRILDLAGRSVPAEQTWRTGCSIQIDINHLASGAYLVLVQQNGRTWIEKLQVAR